MKHLAEWRYALGGSGGQCVMTIGTTEMQLLSVDNLDSVQMVSHSGANDNKGILLSKQLKWLHQVTNMYVYLNCVNKSIL